MNGYPSPLESLAAFAIAFAAGVLSTAVLARYVDKVHADARRTVAEAG
ncbi:MULTISPECIES: hypothetical protein [unclassified Burkholderia]|nr:MULTISPECIES: hypothetical protein [unclassified Burkholderia]